MQVRALLLVIGMTLSTYGSSQRCKPLSFSQFKERAQGLEVVFYASWCRDCLVHLKEARVGKTFLLATFDEFDRAIQVLSDLKIDPKIPCGWDRSLEIVKNLGVSSLPKTLDWQEIEDPKHTKTQSTKK